MAKRKEDAEVLAILMDSPLAGLVDLVRSGDTPFMIKEEMGENETKVRDFSAFEIALYGFIEKLRTEANEAGKSAKKLMESEDKDWEKEVKALARENNTKGEIMTLMNRLFWIHLESSSDFPYGENSIRKGFILTNNPTKKEPGGGAISLGIGLPHALFEAIAKMGIDGGHECKNCPPERYADCDLPFKQAR